MDIGLLWFDNDPRTDLEEKIRRAAGHYREKYGRSADICYANAKMLAEQWGTRGKIEIKMGNGRLRVIGAGNILPHHFWLGNSSDDDSKCPRH